MSTVSSSTEQPGRVPPLGILAWLAGLAKAIVFPFDKILAGMVRAGLCADALCQLLDLSRTLLDEHIVRLGLCTPGDRPFRRPAAAGWSVADTQRLIAWRAAAVHPEVIGNSLDRQRSASAVRTKARRLGLTAPARAELFRPDPAALIRQRPDFGFAAPASPQTNCGRAAGPVTVRLADTTAPASAPGTKIAARHPPSEGHRELALFGIVGGTAHNPPIRLKSPPAPDACRDLPPLEAAGLRPKEIPAAVPVPRTREEIDYDNLTWIGALKQPLTNELAVFAVGMLFMSGLHWRAVAGRVDVTPGALRTLRTRMRIPVDPDRGKICQVFDSGVARATMERGAWLVRRSLRAEKQQGADEYFWVERSDRGTRFSPHRRKRDRMIERRSPEMTIITRAQLDAEARARSCSFAGAAMRMTA